MRYAVQCPHYRYVIKSEKIADTGTGTVPALAISTVAASCLQYDATQYCIL